MQNIPYHWVSKNNYLKSSYLVFSCYNNVVKFQENIMRVEEESIHELINLSCTIIGYQCRKRCPIYKTSGEENSPQTNATIFFLRIRSKYWKGHWDKDQVDRRLLFCRWYHPNKSVHTFPFLSYRQCKALVEAMV